MKDYIEERALEIANYIIREKATVRQTASIFGVSKSTVHKDVTERLPKINPLISVQVKKVLEKNKAERHIRGGKATKLKYETLKAE
ncbi:sporulation transcriptional regulator SpoIIID [Clostridiisalibacter paucivorans]|uniref:sporulation transcriptional regulator SpoIIID n=1 Tax=Clostridiisalibacter paucivorans TaxID=408753 RepID=UPI000479350C|nr:sporulation transcriptional regulator SpoIIID [Clostridiisalibacter paucivorans]